ncbi:NTP transferase domain-containing protein [Anaerosinus massiliensis]|uniref:NTP transferase domain-containing protein n=1 Tax=Massilibacillus massiliensis TaxID=1806837 RepID=UPI000ABEC9B6|nr:NTP transferase domain-containing protein [Massilibacillus massiliensis]
MYNAIVLAGGISKKLSADHAQMYEAFIDIGGKPMLSFILEALQQSKHIAKIIVAGPSNLSDRMPLKQYDITFAQSGKTILDTVTSGLKASQSSCKTLIVTVDVPFITTEAIDDFIRQCEEKDGDFYYPIIEKQISEVKFPQAKRTYVKLSDGIFTGGNIFLVNPNIVPQCMLVAEKMIKNRKKPWKLASLLGWGTLIRFILGNLSVDAARNRVSEILGVRGVVILSNYPELGMDMDKISDIELARQYFI